MVDEGKNIWDRREGLDGLYVDAINLDLLGVGVSNVLLVLWPTEGDAEVMTEGVKTDGSK